MSDKNINLALCEDGRSKDGETEVSCWDWSAWSSFGQFSSSAFMLRMPDFLLVLAVVKLRFMYSSIRNHLGINWHAGCRHHRDGSLLLMHMMK